MSEESKDDQNIIEEKSIGLRIPKRPVVIDQVYYLGIGLFIMCIFIFIGSDETEQNAWLWVVIGFGLLVQLVFFSTLLNQLYQINCNTLRQYEGFKFTQEERQKK